MTFTKNMFNEIKASLSNKNDNSYKDIMKFEPGKTYVVRLIPNMNDPKRTIYHYYHHSWKSYDDGKFISALCPTTYGESCPIDSYVLKTYNTGTQEEKNKLRDISRKENWMVNAYVVSDPTNPENEGKVKIIRYGKELAKIINAAIDGDDSDEFGVKIFDIAAGCSFKIKCESRTGGPTGNRMMITYTSSKFMSPSKLDGITDSKLEEIYNGVFELDKFIKPKTSAELQRLLEQHFFCIKDVNSNDDDEDSDSTPVKATSTKNDALDSIFEGIKDSPMPTVKAEQPNTPAATTADKDDTDAKLKELLASL
jgi:hypothetical protein